MRIAALQLSWRHVGISPPAEDQILFRSAQRLTRSAEEPDRNQWVTTLQTLHTLKHTADQLNSMMMPPEKDYRNVGATFRLVGQKHATIMSNDIVTYDENSVTPLLSLAK